MMLLLVLLLGASCALLLAPSVVIVASAFGRTGYLAFPPHGVTLRWFMQAVVDPAYAAGLATSILTATAVTVAAMLLGMPAAYALARYAFPGRELVEAALVLPLALPAIVLSLALVIVASHIGLPPSMPRLVAAHLLVCTPCIIRVLLPAFQRQDRTPEHAARVFGASSLATFMLVTLPLSRASLASAAAVSWIVSFEDFELALFHASPAAPTLPMVIYAAIEVGAPPVVAATCALLIAAAIAGAIIWQCFTRRN